MNHVYRYCRCSRKVAKCSEPYVQEKFVAAQCLDLLKPLAISPEQASHVRTLIDAETKKENDAAGTGAEQISDALSDTLSDIQKKLNKITRGYLDELIDEESYQAATSDLVNKKTTLKQEKQRLHKTGSSFWNEPAKDVINTLEMAGKMQAEKSPQEISHIVHKVGTNRLLSRKTVSFFFSEPYDFVPSLLASLPISTRSTTNTSPSLGDENPESPVWCA
jgi:molecular chaperone GrpE (heat shock protein)